MVLQAKSVSLDQEYLVQFSQIQKGTPPTHQVVLQPALHKYLDLVVETLPPPDKNAGFLTTKILLS